jgi:hypothetical protein
MRKIYPILIILLFLTTSSYSFSIFGDKKILVTDTLGGVSKGWVINNTCMQNSYCNISQLNFVNQTVYTTNVIGSINASGPITAFNFYINGTSLSNLFYPLYSNPSNYMTFSNYLTNTSANNNSILSVCALRNISIFNQSIDATPLSYANMRIGQLSASTSPRIIFEYNDGFGSDSIWQMDNDGNELRFFNNTATKVRINESGLYELNSRVCTEANGICNQSIQSWTNTTFQTKIDTATNLSNYWKNDGTSTVTANWNLSTKNITVGSITFEPNRGAVGITVCACSHMCSNSTDYYFNASC